MTKPSRHQPSEPALMPTAALSFVPTNHLMGTLLGTDEYLDVIEHAFAGTAVRQGQRDHR
jgi:hypothetical protein